MNESSDIVASAEVVSLPTGDLLKLRLDIGDGSLLDVFASANGPTSYHQERHLASTGALYRHDNAPHDQWGHVTTFPKHFHDGSENSVIESHIGGDPDDAIREFLSFVCHGLLSRS